MDVTANNNNIIIRGLGDFSLRQVFECGQCFRFNPDADGYTGTAFGRTVHIAERRGEIVLSGASTEDFNSVWRGYFDLDRDYGEIKRKLTDSGDPVMAAAVRYGGGIRILRQEPWETLISFIISASNNIPRIKKIIENLAFAFGEPHSRFGNTYYSFPTAERLASLTLDDIDVIRAGFRGKYILACAKSVAEGEIDLDAFAAYPTAEIRKNLMRIKGVGGKVADCVILFGYNRFDAFPIDVWIKRVTEHFYFGGEKQPIKKISEFAEKKFGSLGGIAQQYLFYFAREENIGKTDA